MSVLLSRQPELWEWLGAMAELVQLSLAWLVQLQLEVQANLDRVVSLCCHLGSVNSEHRFQLATDYRTSTLSY